MHAFEHGLADDEVTGQVLAVGEERGDDMVRAPVVERLRRGQLDGMAARVVLAEESLGSQVGEEPGQSGKGAGRAGAGVP